MRFSAWAVFLFLASCARDRSAIGTAAPASVEPELHAPARTDPIRMEALNQSETPPTYVLRGEPRGKARLVFLHGMCGHALGYAQSFQWSAAKKGTLVAPQGDQQCGKGPWAMWSGDIAALDRRIVESFRMLGHSDPIDDIALMGYSQGATRAEALARKWPERYTRLVLLGAPAAVNARGLSSLRAAVLMAGERDRQEQMKAGMHALRAAGIPATFMIIPEATHGAMGPTPEETMGMALDWLWEHSRGRPVPNPNGSATRPDRL